jgi:hypothetical protein
VDGGYQAKKKPKAQSGTDILKRQHTSQIAVHELRKDRQRKTSQNKSSCARQHGDEQRFDDKLQRKATVACTQDLAHRDLALTPDHADGSQVDVVDGGKRKNEGCNGY